MILRSDDRVSVVMCGLRFVTLIVTLAVIYFIL
jgi:hypothetical protein